MCPFLSLLQVELCTADSHLVAMLHKVLNAVLQSEQTWAPFHKGDAVHREATLQGRHLEELIEDDVGIGVVLDINDDAHTLAS